MSYTVQCVPTLCHAAHPPAQITQPASSLSQLFGIADDHVGFWRRGLGWRAIFVASMWKQSQQTSCDLFIVPSCQHIRPTPSSHVDMFVYDRLSQAINGKNTGQESQPLPNPLTSMFIRVTGGQYSGTLATQQKLLAVLLHNFKEPSRANNRFAVVARLLCLA